MKGFFSTLLHYVWTALVDWKSSSFARDMRLLVISETGCFTSAIRTALACREIINSPLIKWYLIRTTNFRTQKFEKDWPGHSNLVSSHLKERRKFIPEICKWIGHWNECLCQFTIILYRIRNAPKLFSEVRFFCTEAFLMPISSGSETNFCTPPIWKGWEHASEGIWPFPGPTSSWTDRIGLGIADDQCRQQSIPLMVPFSSCFPGSVQMLPLLQLELWSRQHCIPPDGMV